MTYYEQGFLTKCAEYGVDPRTAELMLKAAGWGDRFAQAGQQNSQQGAKQLAPARNFLSRAWNGVKNTAKGAYNTAVGAGQQMLGAGLNGAQKAWNSYHDTMQDVGDAVGRVVSKPIEWAGNAQNAFQRARASARFALNEGKRMWNATAGQQPQPQPQQPQMQQPQPQQPQPQPQQPA